LLATISRFFIHSKEGFWLASDKMYHKQNKINIFRGLLGCAERQNLSLSVEKYFMSEHSERVKYFST